MEDYDYKGTWSAGPIKCDLCGHECVAVRPTDIEKLECSHCGNMASYEEIEED
jgi:hypothetical protein